MVFLKNGSFLCQEKFVSININSCSLFFYFFQVNSRFLIGIRWGQELICEYFCADCIPSILSKNLDRDLRNTLLRVHLSMTYCQNEILKKFQTCQSIMMSWPLENVFVISVAFLLFLNAHNITCRKSTFRFSSLGHTLN